MLVIAILTFFSCSLPPRNGFQPNWKKWLDDLLDEFGYARCPVHALLRLTKYPLGNTSLTQAISVQILELPITEIQTDLQNSEFLDLNLQMEPSPSSCHASGNCRHDGQGRWRQQSCHDPAVRGISWCK